MPDFYVLPAHLIENAVVVAAVGERNAATKAGQRDGIVGGRVAVIPASSVVYKTLTSITTVDAED